MLLTGPKNRLHARVYVYVLIFETNTYVRRKENRSDSENQRFVYLDALTEMEMELREKEKKPFTFFFTIVENGGRSNSHISHKEICASTHNEGGWDFDGRTSADTRSYTHVTVTLDSHAQKRVCGFRPTNNQPMERARTSLG